MTAPTQPVTVRIADFGGDSIAGILVTARMDNVDYTADGTFVANTPVTGTTDENGLVVLQCFPNATTPTGLGTRGTVTRFIAQLSNSRSLDVLALVPNTPCNLVNILTDENPPLPTAADIAMQQAQQAVAQAQVQAGIATTQADTATTMAGTATTQAGIATTQAGIATAQAGAASTSRTAIDNRLYPGTFASNPTTRPDGSAIQNGDRYVNSTDGSEYIRVGGAWTNAAGSALLAQAWATQTGAEVVAGQGFGAKKYAQDASGSASAAAIAKTQAETFAALAATGAKFYDTIALGRAGVADTFTFGVKAGGSDGLLRATVYRRDSSSTQTLLFSVIPGSEIDARFPAVAPTGYAFALLDPDGRMAFAVKTDGTVEIASLSMALLQVTKLGTANAIMQDLAALGYAWGITDQDGRMGVGVKSDGTLVGGAVEAVTLNGTAISTIIAGAIAGASGSAATSVGNFDAEVNGFDTYGQSKANGTSSLPVITTAQAYDNLKFNGGVRPGDAGGTSASQHASLQPLTETALSTTNGETPVGGTTDYIKQRIQAKYSIAYTQQSYQMLGSSAGQGGTAIAGLSSGTTPFQNLKDNIAYGYSLSQAAGKTYKFRAFGWSQGESDYIGNTPAATYGAALIQLRTDADTYAKSVTGQADNVVCIIDQVGAHALYGHTNDPYIALKQLDVCNTQAGFYMACPVYFLPQSDPPHFTSAASKWLGAYYGRVYTRVVIEGGTWKPLQPLSAYRQGSVAMLRMSVPTLPLALDAVNVAAVANSGFTLVNSGGTPITISSVSIVEKDTVKIVAATAIPAGAKLRYGFGSGGNLRDSDAEVFTISGTSYPLYNWCVIFEQVLA